MDPSMLIGFLIKDEADWEDWKRRLKEVKGKAIVSVFEKEPPIPGETKERKEAVDEVETFDDEDEDNDAVTVTRTEEQAETQNTSQGEDEPVRVEHNKDVPVEVAWDCDDFLWLMSVWRFGWIASGVDTAALIP